MKLSLRFSKRVAWLFGDFDTVMKVVKRLPKIAKVQTVIENLNAVNQFYCYWRRSASGSRSQYSFTADLLHWHGFPGLAPKMLQIICSAVVVTMTC